MQIHPRDNVSLSLEDGHKYALKPLRCGDTVIKYGQPIGHATADITAGEWVHTHNLATNLSGKLEYDYQEFTLEGALPTDLTFMGYPRGNGDVGIRNDIFIVVTVGCVNQLPASRQRSVHGNGIEIPYYSVVHWAVIAEHRSEGAHV